MQLLEITRLNFGATLTAARGFQYCDCHEKLGAENNVITLTAARGFQYCDNRNHKYEVANEITLTAARGFQYCDNRSMSSRGAKRITLTAARGFQYCDGHGEPGACARESTLTAARGFQYCDIEDVLPEQETEHWKKIGSTIALYERWPLLWHRDPVWVARAKHIAKIAAEGTVPVNVLEKLWQLSEQERSDIEFACLMAVKCLDESNSTADAQNRVRRALTVAGRLNPVEPEDTPTPGGAQ